MHPEEQKLLDIIYYWLVNRYGGKDFTYLQIGASAKKLSRVIKSQYEVVIYASSELRERYDGQLVMSALYQLKGQGRLTTTLNRFASPGALDIHSYVFKISLSKEDVQDNPNALQALL